MLSSEDPPGYIRVKGTLVYDDPELGTRPARWFKFEIRDRKVVGSDVLETGIVGADGKFASSWIQNIDEYGSLDIEVAFIPETTAARVLGNWGASYEFLARNATTGETVWWDVIDGEELNVGNQTNGGHGASRVYEYIMDGWDYIANGPPIWTPPQVIAVWTEGHDARYYFEANESDMTHYHGWGNQIHVHSEHEDSPDVIIHEYGHHIMDTRWGEWWPPNATGEHTPNSDAETLELAWTEGWANFFSSSIRGATFTDRFQNFTIDLERREYLGPGSNQWESIDARGGLTPDFYESIVASALYDLYDSAPDGLDTLSLGFKPIWDVLVQGADPNHRQNTFADFWDAFKRTYRGDDSRVHFSKMALYQNTIDYDSTPTSEIPNLDDTVQPATTTLNAFAVDLDSEDQPYTVMTFYYSLNGIGFVEIATDENPEFVSLPEPPYKYMIYRHDWDASNFWDVQVWAGAMANDGMKNSVLSITGPFAVSVAPRVSLLTSIPDGWYLSEGTLDFSWTIPDGQNGVAGYSYVFDSNPLTEPDGTRDTANPSATIHNVVDGTWYLHVKAQSNNGAWSDTAHFKVDIPNPFRVVYPVDGGFTVTGMPTFRWDYTINTYGDPVTIEVNGPNTFTKSGITEKSIQVGGFQDGTYTWRVGTWLWSDTWQFVVDTDSTISNVTLESGWRNDLATTVTASINEPVTAIDRMELWWRHSGDNVNWGDDSDDFGDERYEGHGHDDTSGQSNGQGNSGNKEKGK